tara:strand:+ start:261 stop:536 length:276 start_codon:yes stop_codon:yes gene_type:complete
MTKRVTLQPGDLVCYNVGGTKETSLAHVVEVRHPKRWSVGDALMDMEERTGSIFVLWIKVGEYKPRTWDYTVKSGRVVKHPYNSAFEKVSE